jgi:hypothetical protein
MITKITRPQPRSPAIRQVSAMRRRSRAPTKLVGQSTRPDAERLNQPPQAARG